MPMAGLLVDNSLVLVEENANCYNLAVHKEISVFDLSSEQILLHLECSPNSELDDSSGSVGFRFDSRCEYYLQGDSFIVRNTNISRNEICRFLGPRRIMSSFLLGHEEGEGCSVERWILLQVESVVRVRYPTEEFPMLHSVVQEVWAVPMSDPRLSQGAPLGFDWGSFCQYYDSEFRILSVGVDELANDPKVIRVQELLEFIPSARQQFVQRVLEPTSKLNYDFNSLQKKWIQVQRRRKTLLQNRRHPLSRIIPVLIVSCGVLASGHSKKLVFLLTFPPEGFAIDQFIENPSDVSPRMWYRLDFVNSIFKTHRCIENHVMWPICSREEADPFHSDLSMVLQISCGSDSHLYSLNFKPTELIYERFLPMFAGVTLLGGGNFKDPKLPPLLFFTAFSPNNLSSIRRGFFVFDAVTELVCDASSLVEDVSLTLCVLGHDSVAVGAPSHNPPFTWLQVSRILSLPFHPPQSFVDSHDSWFKCFIPNDPMLFNEQLSTTFKVPSRSKFCYTRNEDFLSYRVVAGLGPVPSFFRAPDDVYVSLNSPKDLGGYLGGVMWYEESATPGVIRERTIGDWMYERISTGCLQVYKNEAKKFVPHVDKETDDGEMNGQKWIGIIDKCCDSDLASSTSIEQKVFSAIIGDDGYPTLRDSNGTPYFEVSSGGLAVGDLVKKSDAVIMRNCANGKWYWELGLYSRLGVDEQLDIWHESVAGNTELDSDNIWHESLAGNTELDSDNVSQFEYFDWSDKSESRKASMTEVEQLWKEAKEKVACLSRLNADVISLVCQFMTTDPDSDFWVKEELANGFLLHHRLFSGLYDEAVGSFDAAQYRSETALLPPHGKYLFGEEFNPSSIRRTLLWDSEQPGADAGPVTLPHGCAFLSTSSIGCVMFKRDPTTNKIVTGRFQTKELVF